MNGMPRWLAVAALPALLVAGAVIAALFWAYGPGSGPAAGGTGPGQTAGADGVAAPSRPQTPEAGGESGAAPGTGEASSSPKPDAATTVAAGQTDAESDRVAPPADDVVPILPRPSLGQSVTRFENGPDQAYMPGAPAPSPGADASPVPATVPDRPGRAYGESDPASPPRDIDDAVQILNREFTQTTIAGVSLTLHGYFRMEAVANGEVALGILRTEQYAGWERLAREHPEDLRNWLKAAARRVMKAEDGDDFQVSWALVDVIDGPPLGWAHHELKALPDGRWLVVRPLAATSYLPTDATIFLRPGSELAGAATPKATAWIHAWGTYAPPVDPEVLDPALRR